MPYGHLVELYIKFVKEMRVIPSNEDVFMPLELLHDYDPDPKLVFLGKELIEHGRNTANFFPNEENRNPEHLLGKHYLENLETVAASGKTFSDFNEIDSKIYTWKYVRAAKSSRGSYYVCVYGQDVTELWKDPLTGLLQFQVAGKTRLDRLVAEFTESGRRDIAVIVMDGDHFKDVNDLYGHDKGDALLKAIAKSIEKNKRTADDASRNSTGGDEFYLVMAGFKGLEEIDKITDVDLVKVRRFLVSVGHGIIHGLTENPEIRSITRRVGFGLGMGIVTGFDVNNFSSRDLLDAADIAMCHAKSLGPNNIRFFHDLSSSQRKTRPHRPRLTA